MVATKKTYFIFLKLLIAAVILFGLFILFSDATSRFSGLAFFGGSDNGEQSLIVEQALKAQFQYTKERMLREGSYVYSFGYKLGDQTGDLDEGLGGAQTIDSNVLIQGIAFLSPSNPSDNLLNNIGVFDKNRSSIITYKVQPGDTPSYIAASFGISTNTLLWANDLNYWSIIKPGQELVILPTSGVIHKVKKGETLAAIVKKYKGDLEETIAYNGLPANSYVEVNQEIIIPNGKKTITYQPRARLTYQPSSYIGPYGGVSRSFPWGQCTWYVAQKRYVPWSGHAKYWLSNARAYGFNVCLGRNCEPRPGAIMATNESWYGHVAYIEAVNGDYITVSEMFGVPYWRKGIRNVRTFKKGDWRIRGYIY